MFKGSFWKVICLAVAVMAVNGCKRSAPATQPPAPAPPKYFRTPFQDESQYIVENIISDLAEQLYFTGHQQMPDPRFFSVTATETPNSPLDAPVYDLKIDLGGNQRNVTAQLNVNGPIWSPEVYSGVVQTLATAIGVQGTHAATPVDTDLLRALTDGWATTIEEQSLALSDELQTNFSDPTLQAEAAVVLGAFALREHSGDFYDVRAPLCRITAHLAMAEFLAADHKLDLNGQMAQAMLLTLMNNEADAVKLLSTMATNDAATACWVRVLQADNTGDYRELAPARQAPLTERIAKFQAKAKSLGLEVAWRTLDNDDKQVPDFGRMGAEQGYSVGVGNEMINTSVANELREIGAVYGLAKQMNLDNSNFAQELNEMPERCFLPGAGGKPRVQLIPWGQWAMFYQRQLGHALRSNFNFLQNKLNAPDDARTFSEQSAQMFGRLLLYPFVQRFNAGDSVTFHQSVDAGFRFTVEHPQLTPAGCWLELCNYGPNQEIYRPVPNPHINEWYQHNPPPGTAYNISARFEYPSLSQRHDVVEKLEKLHTLAPYDLALDQQLIRFKYQNQPNGPSPKESEDIYKLTLPYVTHAMFALAYTVRDQPERYEALMTNAAAQNPDYYFELAKYFISRHQDDKAAVYDQTGIDLTSNRVNASDEAEWLVHYYLDHKQVRKAEKLANMAGEVYSGTGLAVKAYFLEATHDYAGAEAWYRKIIDRYNDANPLMSFFIRYKAATGDTRYDDELKRRSAELFPKGIEHVRLDEFKGPPVDGTFIRQANQLTWDAGMNAGCIIVAVNGIRAHTFDQYVFGRDLMSGPFKLIVWDGKQYREVTANPPSHRFDVDMDDYKP